MTERRLPNEMPDALRTLARYVVVGFYSVECQLIVELMHYYRRITEDDMLKLLQFDRKQLRSAINTLKQDKFVHSRALIETGPDNRATRHTYYYIDYGLFTNVVKYKLHQVRTKIEAMERDATTRASFHCPCCFKTFTDLEAGQLFDTLSQTFKCTYCFSEVVEDLPENGGVDTRKKMVTFNEQMAPIFSLLRELDGIKLSDLLLEPPLVKETKTKSSSSASKNSEKEIWSGDATKNINIGISRQDAISISTDSHGQPKTARAMPTWISKSAIEPLTDAVTHDTEIVLPSMPSSSSSAKEGQVTMDKDDIMKTLLSHERRIPTTDTQPDKNTSSQSDEEAENEDEKEFMVTVGGNKVPYNVITADMVSRMIDSEKEEYVRVGREMHEYYE